MSASPLAPWARKQATALPSTPGEASYATMVENGRIVREMAPIAPALTSEPIRTTLASRVVFNLDYGASPSGADLKLAAFKRQAKQRSKVGAHIDDLIESVVNVQRLGLPGQNADALLSELVPYLLRMMSEEHAIRVAEVALATAGTHPTTEWSHCWGAAHTAWLTELNETERGFHEELNQPKADAFRILRDLAKGKKGEVFMSEAQLKKRVAGLTNGWRTMQQFVQWSILEPLEKGQAWEAGKKAKASRYRWALADFSNEPPRKKFDPASN